VNRNKKANFFALFLGTSEKASTPAPSYDVYQCHGIGHSGKGGEHGLSQADSVGGGGAADSGEK